MTRALVIYEVPTNLPLLLEVIKRIDSPADSKIIEFVKLTYADASTLGQQLQAVFTEESQAQQAGETAEKSPGARTRPAPSVVKLLLSAEREVTIHAIERTNHLVLRGYREDLARIKELIRQLDVPADLETRNYQVMHLIAQDVFASLQEALGVFGRSGYGGRMWGRGRSGSRLAAGTGGLAQGSGDTNERIRLSLLEDSNSIVVTASAVVHRQVMQFLEICDQPPARISGGIRTYKLENADAAEVAKIIQELVDQGERGREQGRLRVGEAHETVPITGPSQQTPPSPPPPPGAGPAAVSPAPDGSVIGLGGDERIERPRVTFSEATNSVIIQATLQQHTQLAELIERLDRRLAQVMIEVILLELRGSDDVDVGVELESFQTPGDSAGHLLFTSFGLSTVDPVTGQRSPARLPGGTGAIIRTDEIPVILHALQQTGRAKIRSVPRLLVNDNSVGQVLSIAEEPYTQVNASDTVATTSFGGFVRAGTQLLVTPHISEEGYLRVEYEITLNSFRGPSTDPTLPPARDSSTIASQATVPDGDSLIVGGLLLERHREMIDRVPLLGDIPVVGQLFRRTVDEKENAQLYVFVSPVILQDDQFRDLRRMSEHDRREADESSPYPVNPVLDLEEG